MDLHNVLPFSSSDFFYFIGAAILFVLIAKTVFRKIIPFKWIIAVISATYLAFLFPKPLQLLGILAYLYICITLLKLWYKRENIVFPMLLLSLPIFFMKFVVLYPDETAPRAISSIKMIIQIAGLSYIVFKAIGMYLDIRRKPGFVNVLDFYNFLTFVPTLLIGPLDRFERFNTDIKNGYASVNTSMYGKAWNNFILGLLFKFILAEAVRRLVLSQLVDDGSFGYHVSYMYTYLFYLFFDFAGYSLLAIGFGNFLGIDVPINFDKPFLSVNPKEFWKRWHKSLGDWLGDYFFKPIFKYFTSKKIFESMQRQSIALFLTFTLMGFWNGFELHYIVSGMLFGVYSMVHNYYANQCKKQKKDVFFGNLNEKWVRVLSICIMFNLVAIAIYIFSGNLF